MPLTEMLEDIALTTNEALAPRLSPANALPATRASSVRKLDIWP
jgi:hypothetical protein